MKIYKFGGASLKNPENLKNIYDIVSIEENLIIVVSAIDKTTNALEKAINSFYNNNEDKFIILEKIRNFHLSYINNCFTKENINNVISEFNQLYEKFVFTITNVKDDYDRFYDSVICYGELFSSLITSKYLTINGLQNTLVDVRKLICTDSNFRDSKILWDASLKKINNCGINFSGKIITQGFIGITFDGEPTSLGREGSDYTAAALSYLLDAESVTIWKDVPGIMNADPSWCDFAEKLDLISYREAIELAFYGAKVIHPKTIKPLENKEITLYVKSFLNPKDSGTIVKKNDYKLDLIPIYILKDNQILLSLSARDFSFIVEENLGKIFNLFAEYKIKVNIMQNSAISFSVAIDGNNRNFEILVNELKKDFTVKYNKDVELVTIRYYTDEAIKRITESKKILLEQKSRNTARFVLKKV